MIDQEDIKVFSPFLLRRTFEVLKNTYNLGFQAIRLVLSSLKRHKT